MSPRLVNGAVRNQSKAAAGGLTRPGQHATLGNKLANPFSLHTARQGWSDRHRTKPCSLLSQAVDISKLSMRQMLPITGIGWRQFTCPTPCTLLTRAPRSVCVNRSTTSYLTFRGCSSGRSAGRVLCVTLLPPVVASPAVWREHGTHAPAHLSRLLCRRRW